MRQKKVITIVDYGAGNLRSVANAITKLGYRPTITSDPGELLKAGAVILPGVGAAADTMSNLEKLGLVTAIRQFIAEDRPFLGICVGLQILFTGTEEGERHECLDIFSGQVKKLPSGLKIPHMGWNQVRQRVSHPVFEDIPDETNFYFVHSYYVEPDDKSLVIADTEYGIPFCSVMASRNLIGIQFHPEKSGRFGLNIYRNFIRSALAVR